MAVIVPVYRWANWFSCLTKELPNFTQLCVVKLPLKVKISAIILSATFAQLEVLWPGHSWLHPAKFSLCQVSAFSEQGPRPVGPFALLWVQAGQRPHSHCFWEQLGAQLALSNLSLLCHIWLPAFQGSSIIPRVLLQGQRLTEVFTCLKMYQDINRSYFPSILWSWVCSFLFHFLPHLSAFIKKKRSKGEKKNNSPTKQFQIDRKSIHLASQKIYGKASGPQKKKINYKRKTELFWETKWETNAVILGSKFPCISDGCLWEFCF